MIYKAMEALDKVFRFERSSAHCDIPCGIYDPHHALIGALTVIRMIDLMGELANTHPQQDQAYFNSMARYVRVKEEHAELTKHEVRIIYGDYFKQEMIDKYPELPALVHKIYQSASKGRQTTSRESAMELLNAVSVVRDSLFLPNNY